MNSRLRGLVAALAAATFGAAAFAGMKSQQQVVINDDKSSAWGDLGWARNSANTTEYIGCHIIGSGNEGMGVCTARNAAGVTRSCTTQVSAYLYTITAINSDSFVQFKWNSSGNCTMVIVETNSSFMPKR